MRMLKDVREYPSPKYLFLDHLCSEYRIEVSLPCAFDSEHTSYSFFGPPLSFPDLFLCTITLPTVSCDPPPTLSYTTLEIASRVFFITGVYIMENTPPPPRGGGNKSQCHLGEKI
jgi:hypothetical protein